MVLLVEDFPRTSRAIERMLRPRWAVHASGTIAGAKSLADRSAPTVALVDVLLPDGSGLDLVRWLRKRWPTLPVAVITGMLEPTVVNDVMALEATLIAKPVAHAPILLFLDRVERGRNRLRLEEALTRAARRFALTAREHDLLRHVSDGHSVAEFAAHAGIALDTARGYGKSIRAKSGARRIENLVIRVLRDALDDQQ